MATEVIHQIKADGTGDYTTLADWQTAQVRNLVALDEIAVAEITGTLSVGLTVSSSWTTNPTNRIIIRAAAGQKHTGTPGTGAKIAGTLNGSVISSQKDIEVRDLHLEVSGSYNSRFCINTTTNGMSLRAVGCLFTSVGTGFNPCAIGTIYSGANLGFEVYNNIQIGGGTFIEYADAWRIAQKGFIANNTSDAAFPFSSVSSTGTDNGSSLVIVNNVWTNATRDWSNRNISHAVCKSNATNLSQAASTLPGSDHVYDVTAADFTNAAGNDFTLSAGSKLIGVGYDMAGVYATDLIGTTRRTPIDIGAFESAKATPTNVPASAVYLSRRWRGQPQGAVTLNPQYNVAIAALPGVGFIGPVSGSNRVPHTVIHTVGGRAFNAQARTVGNTVNISTIGNRASNLVVVSAIVRYGSIRFLRVLGSNGYGWDLAADTWDSRTMKVALYGSWSGGSIASIGATASIPNGVPSGLAAFLDMNGQTRFDVFANGKFYESRVTSATNGPDPTPSAATGHVATNFNANAAGPVNMVAIVRNATPAIAGRLSEFPYDVFAPVRQRFFSLPSGGIVIPTLSLPGVTDITTTSVRPKVTLEF